MCRTGDSHVVTGPSSRRRFLRRAGVTLSFGGVVSLSGCVGRYYDGGGRYTDTGFRIANYDEEMRLSAEEYAEFADRMMDLFGEHGPWDGTTRSPFPQSTQFQWALSKPEAVTNAFVQTHHVGVVFRDTETPSRYYLYLWSGGRPRDSRDLLRDRPNLRYLQQFVAYSPERGTMTDWQPRPPITSGPVSVSLGGENVTYPLETGRLVVADNVWYNDLAPDEMHRVEWVGSTEGAQSLHSVASFDVTTGEFNPAIELMFGGSRRGGPLFG
jgi:hypothetical protein